MKQPERNISGRAAPNRSAMPPVSSARVESHWLKAICPPRVSISEGL